MNMSQSAKGTWQLDVTAEFPTVAETEKALSEAIEAARRVAAEKGLVLAS